MNSQVRLQHPQTKSKKSKNNNIDNVHKQQQPNMIRTSRPARSLMMRASNTRVATSTPATVMHRQKHVAATPQDAAQVFQYSKYGLRQRVSQYFYNPKPIKSMGIEQEEAFYQKQSASSSLSNALTATVIFLVSGYLGFSLSTGVSSIAPKEEED